MLLLNFDFYDIYSALTMLRAKPEKESNVEIMQSILDVLSAPQTDAVLVDNIIRKKLRTIEGIDKETFYWVYVDNVYTYGWKVIKEERGYTFLANGFRMMLEVAKAGDIQRLENLADALHNIPILLADGCKNFNKAANKQFLYYNQTYSANLLKELSK